MFLAGEEGKFLPITTEVYGSVEIIQKKQAKRDWATKLGFAFLPYSGLLEPTFTAVHQPVHHVSVLIVALIALAIFSGLSS
jgi:hypothetical protein